MLIHNVFFWLKPELTDAQRAEFKRQLETLAGIRTVVEIHIGTPAPVPARPVVDASYSFALTIAFADMAGHDAYQSDPLHQAFLANCRALWTRVQIYDAA